VLYELWGGENFTAWKTQRHPVETLADADWRFKWRLGDVDRPTLGLDFQWKCMTTGVIMRW